MKHILFAVSLLFSISQVVHSDSALAPATDRGRLFVTLKGNFLLLRPEAPASAALPIDSSTPSVETQIQQLTGTLKYTAGIFDFPQKADCRRRRVVVMPSDEPGIIAEWHFTCGRPQYLDSVSTRLFALMHLHSIQAVILPHGQWTLRPDEPLLQLQKR